MSGGSSFSTPQTHFLQKTKELREQQQHQTSAAPSLNSPQTPTQPTTPGTTIYSPDKPPIPPRGNPPPVPQRQISSNETVQLRIRSGKLSNQNFIELKHKDLMRKLFSLSDANSNYGNSPNRPHSHQPDFQNGSSNESWNQQQYKMGKL